jgi:hypothetical protein
VPFLGGGFLTDDFVHVERLLEPGAWANVLGTPDSFGFYRPITQATLALDASVHGRTAIGFRATNLILHAAVLAGGFLVARLVLSRALAAALATLAFALTPKAHPIAVLWTSARAELLLALFSFAAVAAWIIWSRNGGGRWLVLASVAYLLAVLSKETAFLVPLLLLATPAATRPLRARLSAVALLLCLGALAFSWRAHVGALLPVSGDAHYDLATPLMRWTRNATNYTMRLIPAGLGLVVLVGSAGFLASKRQAWARVATREQMNVLLLAALWILVFLVPVLPIVARNELYVYLPGYGACLLAGSVTDALVRGSGGRRTVLVTTGLYVAMFGGYQISRSADFHRDLDFSAKMVAALRNSPELAERNGTVALIPADPETERYLLDAFGGYLSVVLQHAFEDGRFRGVVERSGTPPASSAIRLLCQYQQGTVRLKPLPSSQSNRTDPPRAGHQSPLITHQPVRSRAARRASRTSPE